MTVVFIANVLKMVVTPVTGLEKIGKAPKSKTGTKVTFMPDASIFSTTDFKFNTISERLKESAFLLKECHYDIDRLGVAKKKFVKNSIMKMEFKTLCHT